MDKDVANFLRNLNETKHIWIPLLILFIVLAPIFAFFNLLSSSQSYILVNMVLSVLLSVAIIYFVYKVTEISPEDRFSQLVSIWLVFLIAAVISILILDILPYFISTNNSFIEGLMIQDFSLSIYLVVFSIIFVFFVLLFYLILSFNFDTFFPLVCLILILGLYFEYARVSALGAPSIALVFAIIFIIIFAIYSSLPEKEKEAMRKIKLTPEMAAVIYAFAFLIFFVTHFISSAGIASNSTLLSTALEVIDIFALAVMLFVTVFLCSLFWTRDTIVKWYNESPHKKTQIYKKD